MCASGGSPASDVVWLLHLVDIQMLIAEVLLRIISQNKNKIWENVGN